MTAGIPRYVPPGNPVIVPVTMTEVLAQLDERDCLARVRAQASIRRWALALIGVIGVPSGLQFWDESQAPAATDVQLAETQQEIAKSGAAIRETLRALIWIMLELQVREQDSTKYIGAKIDRVHKRARTIQLPDPKRHAELIQTRVVKLLGPNH